MKDAIISRSSCSLASGDLFERKFKIYMYGLCLPGF